MELILLILCWWHNLTEDGLGWLIPHVRPLFFFFNAMLCGMWDLSSLTRDWTCALCSESAESLLECQGSHQPQLISQRDMPCRWDCLCPPPCLIHYKVSSRWTQISIMTWTKKKIIKRTIQRHSTSICLLWGAREKMSEPGTTCRAKEWWLLSCLFKDTTVDDPASSQT